MSIRSKSMIKNLDDKVRLFLEGHVEMYGDSIVKDCIPHGVFDSLLGIGGEKLVLAYNDTILQQKRVLNIRLPGMTDAGEQRFMRGARLLHRLMTSETGEGRIPPFPMLYEVSTNPLFYVTQYITGVTLRDYIANRKDFLLVDKLVLFKRIVEAVSLLHEAEVVHRDLKPANIIVNSRCFPKILDFGIAFSFQESSLTRTDAVLGTPEYAAPEQMMNAGKVDQRADIYSLAKILFFMVVGDESYDPMRLPNQLMFVIPRALQDNPERRHATTQELIESLSDAFPDFNLCGEQYKAPEDLSVGRAFSDFLLLYGGNPGKVKQLLKVDLTEWEVLMTLARKNVLGQGGAP